MTAQWPGTALRNGKLPIDVQIVALAVAWPVLLSAAIWWPEVPHTPLRIGMAALCGVAAVLPAAPRHRSLLISPLFLLGIISTVLYSLAPWITVLPQTEAWFDRTLLPDFWAPVIRFTEGRSELLVLQFSAASLLAALLLDRLRGEGSPLAESNTPPNLRDSAALWIMRLAGSLIVLCSGLLFARKLAPNATAWLPAGAEQELQNGMAPLISFCVISMIAAAVNRTARWYGAAFAALLIGCVALITLHAAKASAYIVIAALAYLAVLARPSWRKVVIGGVIGMIFLIASLQAVFYMRQPTVLDKDNMTPLRFAIRVVESKLLIRQSVTVACFANVTASSLPAGRNESPFYFLGILVPRLTWPEKPSFSLGQQYARAYCYGTPDAKQSSSITLLGQPIVRAGWAGLLVAQATLIVGLAAVAWVALRRRPVGPILLTALLPWLIDFDQSFALYVGNAAKTAIWMLPLIVTLGFFLRRQATARAPVP